MSIDEQAEQDLYAALRTNLAKLSQWPTRHQVVVQCVLLDLMKLVGVQRVTRTPEGATFMRGVWVTATFFHCDKEWKIRGVLSDEFFTPADPFETCCPACSQRSQSFIVENALVKEG